jgi:hypothetical protein
MKKSILAAFITCAIAIAACNNNPKTEDHNTVIVDTIVKKDTVRQEKAKPQTSNQQVPPAEKTPPIQQPVTQLPPKKVADWRAMMKEYHLLLCKSHNGTNTTDDNIREVELSKELKDIPKTLEGDEKFYFTTEMARTLNMETCK